MQDASPASTREATRAVEAVWRIESARLIGGLTRIMRDVGLAEELAQEALLIALKTWPETGVPRNPGAWLMAAAKRRAIDYFRRNKMAARKLDELGYDIQSERDHGGEDPDKALDDDVGDDVLSLVFTSCHPVLSTDARLALTLRLIGGLTTDEIARAFLAAEPTIAQRIVRAKRTLAEARLPFEVPRGEDRLERLGSVLEVIYLIFNEGYSATSGGDWIRPQLCHEAMRLGRVLAGLMPRETEVLGLLALMEFQASRLGARTAADGSPILLMDQDRRRWDRTLIRHGVETLERAERLGQGLGPFGLQAAIASCHATAGSPAATDWTKIAALYAVLAEAYPSPIVDLNRAVAVGFAFGPQEGLDLLDSVADAPALKAYHLLPSVRGDFLMKLGRRDEARGEFERAAEMTRNEQEKTLLLARAREAAAPN